MLLLSPDQWPMTSHCHVARRNYLTLYTLSVHWSHFEKTLNIWLSFLHTWTALAFPAIHITFFPDEPYRNTVTDWPAITKVCNNLCDCFSPLIVLWVLGIRLDNVPSHAKSFRIFQICFADCRASSVCLCSHTEPSTKNFQSSRPANGAINLLRPCGKNRSRFNLNMLQNSL